MSCDKKNRAVKLAQAKLDEVTAALAEATKQEQDEEKKRADAEAGFIMFVVSSAALGLVSKCRIPTAAVAQRGLFRILLGSSGDDNRSRSRDHVVDSTAKYIDGIGSVAPDAVSGAAYQEAIHHPVGSFSSSGNPATIVVQPTYTDSTNNSYVPIGGKTYTW